jgi:bifunctional ADP-heptose synthase (sugar kinase/adenylyltransferase)
MTGDTANIFVFGDLVLDHFIQAEEKLRFQPVGPERCFNGRQRRTIAGGAANCARLIAALSRGRACLWGLSGHSPWGSFVQILQRSQAQSGAGSGVIFHGSHNESHQMNTITRLVDIDSAGVRNRVFRVDDVPLNPVTNTQRRDALGYLKAECEEHGVDAIILNDLDMNSLSDQLVFDIGRFAKKRSIPLFVDPKRKWDKYRRVSVTCALPNLAEWCSIVEEPGKVSEKRWRKNLLDGKALEPMAVRCLRYMPNADCHLIKFDKDGAVLIGPGDRGRRLIYHIPPHPTTRANLPGQLGAGDVFVAALALEYSAQSGKHSTTERMLESVAKANAVVACYLEMDWQQVPTEHEIIRFDFHEMAIAASTEMTDGLAFLPPSDHTDVDLQAHAVLNSHLVSKDVRYIAKVKELVDFLRDGWDSSDPRSVILTGRGGVGKSDLVDLLGASLSNFGIVVWKDFDVAPKSCPDVDAAIDQIRKKWTRLRRSARGLVIVIDEAFAKAGHLLLRESGKLLLQAFSGGAPNIRFVLADADYPRYRDQVSHSQFVSRCKVFELPSLASRPWDIPYIFMAGCLKDLKKRGIESVRISEAALLSVTNWVLETPEEEQSPRVLIEKAAEIVAVALEKKERKTTSLEISKRHLGDLPAVPGETLGQKRLIRFSWTTLHAADREPAQAKPSKRSPRNQRVVRRRPIH